MEKKKKNSFAVLVNCFGLAIFVVTALASSSSREVFQGIDDFNEGYNRAKEFWSYTDESQTIDIDSLSLVPDQPLVATNEIHK